MNKQVEKLRNSIRDSVFSAFGVEPLTPSPGATHAIRKAMLKELDFEGSVGHQLLRARILRAEDAIGLWFARAELYAQLCYRHNEVIARERVDALTPMFVGNISPRFMSEARARKRQSAAPDLRACAASGQPKQSPRGR